MKMKFLVIFIFLVFTSKVQTQSVALTDEETLAEILQSQGLISYFKTIKELCQSAYKSSEKERLIRLVDYLKIDSSLTDDLERKALRETALYAGFYMRELIGYTNDVLKIYLIAHENVKDKTILDSNAWFIENEISVFYTKLGDYEKAEYYANLLESSLIHYKMTERLSRFYVNKGRKLKSEFKIEEAIEIFEKGYQLADSMNYSSGIFANAINLVEVYNEYPQLGSPSGYLTKASSLLPFFTKDKNYLDRKADLEFGTANYYCLQKKYLEGIASYKESIKTIQQYYSNHYRREFAKRYIPLANAYINIDSLGEAMNSVNKGIASLIGEFNEADYLPPAHLIYAENSFIELFQLKAFLFEKRFLTTGDQEYLKKAIKSIELGLLANDLLRETLIADPSKLVSIRSNKNLIETGIDIHYRLYSQDRSVDNFDAARSFFTRSKSLLYNEKSRRSYIIGKLSAPDKENWSELQKKIITLYENKFDTQRDINSIEGEILECQDQINRIFSYYQTIEVETEKPENYIEYLISADKIYALSVSNNVRTFVELGSEIEFQNLLSRLREFILLKGMSIDDKVLNELFSFLIRPVISQVPSYMVIIPDGAIGFIPFELMKDDNGDYLLENSTISYSYGYDVIIKEFDQDHKLWEVFCMAPDYKIKSQKSNEVSRGSIYHLPYAKIEVDTISSLYADKSLVSISSDKQGMLEGIRTARIFHYAGHAIIDGEVGYLALNEDMEDKHQLSAKEISVMHFPLDMVVLSACETGLGNLEMGEGIRSLGKSFLEAGVRSTIISLWNVNDKSTAQIMIDFYRYLIKGKSKDEALRFAKLDYLRNATERARHPFFWAAFIPAGDMNPI